MRLPTCFRGLAPLLAVLPFALLACVSLTFAQEDREKGEQPNPRKVAPGGGFRIELGEEGEEKPAAKEGGYWIGIACVPAGEELREKLKIKTGLVVLQVFEKSPAAKAGLKRGDAITAVNGKPVGQLEQLAETVGASKGKTLKLEIVREGKRQTIEVQPARRPAGIVIAEEEENEKAERREKEEREEKEEDEEREKLEALRRLRQQLEQLQKKAQAPQGPVIRALASGAPAWVAVPGRLPDDMEVTIQKRGNKPARVTVKQGEKLWRTTEKELSMLPAEARAYVARLLGRAPAQPGGTPRQGAMIIGGPGGPQGGLRFEIREGNEKEGPEVRRIEIREGSEKKEGNEKEGPEVHRFQFKIPEQKPER